MIFHNDSLEEFMYGSYQKFIYMGFAPCFWIDSLLSIIWNNSSSLERIM